MTTVAVALNLVLLAHTPIAAAIQSSHRGVENAAAPIPTTIPIMLDLITPSVTAIVASAHGDHLSIITATATIMTAMSVLFDLVSLAVTPVVTAARSSRAVAVSPVVVARSLMASMFLGVTPIVTSTLVYGRRVMISITLRLAGVTIRGDLTFGLAPGLNARIHVERFRIVFPIAQNYAGPSVLLDAVRRIGGFTSPVACRDVHRCWIVFVVAPLEAVLTRATVLSLRIRTEAAD